MIVINGVAALATLWLGADSTRDYSSGYLGLHYTCDLLMSSDERANFSLLRVAEAIILEAFFGWHVGL